MLSFATAMVEGNAASLEELFAPEFAMTHQTGKVEPRDELLPRIRAGRRNQRMDLNDLKVQIYENVAVVSGLVHVVMGPIDTPFAYDSQFTAVFAAVESRWLMVLYHSTRLATA